MSNVLHCVLLFISLLSGQLALLVVLLLLRPLPNPLPPYVIPLLELAGVEEVEMSKPVLIMVHSAERRRW